MTKILYYEYFKGQKIKENFEQVSTDASFFKFDPLTKTITGYNTGLPADVIIPAQINNVDVLKIGDNAFRNLTGLTNINISHKVTSIGLLAFNGCAKLTNITVSELNSNYSSYNGVLFNKLQTTLIQYPAGNNNTTYNIPDSVTTIEMYAFSNSTGLINITIPDNVTTIGNSAFYYCTGLTNIIIPNKVTTIGDSVFFSCTGLTNITVGALNSNYTSDNGVLFNKLKTILIQYPVGNNNTTYKIPDSVTTIGPYVFSYSTGLTNIIIPDNVTTIGNIAFYNCTGLTNIIIPDKVTTISIAAFNRCTGLTNITIGNNVTTIYRDAFNGCTGLTTIIFKGNNITTIGDSAFFNIGDALTTVYRNSSTLDNLFKSRTNKPIDKLIFENLPTSESFFQFDPLTKTITGYNVGLPSNVIIPPQINNVDVLNIGDKAFFGYTGLNSITIGSTVTAIGVSAFSECTLLNTINIGNNVNTIGINAFVNSTGITNITVSNLNSSFSSDNGVLFNKTKTTLIQYPVGSNNTTYMIPDSVSAIGYRAFYNCSRLTNININNVKTIADYTFRYCTGLTNIIISDRITNIGKYVFDRCTGLKTITIGNNVNTISMNAFSNCIGLTTIIFKGINITNIEVDAFNNIGTSITTIYRVSSTLDNLFKSSTNKPIDLLKFENLPISETLGTYFQFDPLTKTITGYNVGLPSNVVIPEKINNVDVLNIGDKAFFGYTGLISITIGNTVTNIGVGAFSECALLYTINIGNNVNTIGINAFVNSNEIININVSNLNSSFSSDNGVLFDKTNTTLIQYPVGSYNTTYTIPDSVSAIGYRAFYRCTGLTNININNVTTIADYTFRYCSGLTNIIIPDGITNIGKYVFDRCTGLNTITIGNNVNTISMNAFSNCTGLTTIIFKGINITNIEVDAFNNIGTSITTVYRDNSALDNLFKSSTDKPIDLLKFENLSISSQNITSSQNTTAATTTSSQNTTAATTTSSQNATAGIPETSETFFIFNPSTNTITGYNAGIPSNVIIPAKINNVDVLNIGDNAFRNFTRLTNIIIPDRVAIIGQNAFDGCTGLTTIIFKGTDINNIGINAFNNIGTSITTVYSDSIDLEFIFKLTTNKPDDKLKFENLSAVPTSSVLLTSSVLPTSSQITTSSISETYFIFDPSTKTITGYNTGLPSNVIIPAQINNVDVLKIGYNAFANSGINSITIPNSVTEIAENSFINTSNLTNITIEANSRLRLIGKRAFQLSKINSITIPNSVTEISEGAFYSTSTNISNLTNITIEADSQLIKIGTNAFVNSNISNITIPNSMTEIGTGAFNGNTNLTTVYFNGPKPTIGTSVFSIINSNAIGYYYNDFADSWNGITNIDGLIMSQVTNPIHFVVDPFNNQTIIGYNTGLPADVIIPAKINNVDILNINENAFFNCTILTNITIGNNITTIGNSAFKYCTGLTNITIGNNVTSIGDGAFYGCTGLTNITVGALNSNYSSENGVLFNKSKTILIQYPVGNNNTTYNVPDSVTTIDNGAFYNCTGLTNIIIPDNVTTIGYSAFTNCTGLTNIIIGNNVTNIGFGVFISCTGLTNITVGELNSNYSSENGVLFNKSKTILIQYPAGNINTTYNIPESVTTIDYGAFSFCAGLTSITIHDNIITIGEGAFYKCTRLTNIIIGNNVTTIGNSAFYDCTMLTNITIRGLNSNYSSENGVLFNKLKTILIQYPIGNNNTTYTIPDSVTNIGQGAFINCTKLTNITIGNNVTTIELYAFGNCTGLTTIIFRGTNITNIDTGAFNNIGDSITTIYRNSSSLDNLFRSSTNKETDLLRFENLSVLSTSSQNNISPSSTSSQNNMSPSSTSSQNIRTSSSPSSTSSQNISSSQNNISPSSTSSQNIRTSSSTSIPSSQNISSSQNIITSSSTSIPSTSSTSIPSSQNISSSQNIRTSSSTSSTSSQNIRTSTSTSIPSETTTSSQNTASETTTSSDNITSATTTSSQNTISNSNNVFYYITASIILILALIIGYISLIHPTFS